MATQITFKQRSNRKAPLKTLPRAEASILASFVIVIRFAERVCDADIIHPSEKIVKGESEKKQKMCWCSGIV